MCLKVIAFIVISITIATSSPSLSPDDDFAYANASNVEFTVNELQSRVINGQPAQRRQLPWHALVLINMRMEIIRLCAGSLLSSSFVLTEANALLNAVNYDVVLGANHRNDRRIRHRSTAAFFHPSFQPNQGNYNIALLRLDRAFTRFNKYIRPVQLPRPEAEYAGRFAWVSGFGSTTTSQFAINQWATVRVLNQRECHESFPGAADHVLCSVGHDRYHAGPGIGDGGAPLVALERGQYTQIGVFAFLWRADFVRPVGYINTANPAIRQWIRSITSV